jgi:hypothetical protein
MCERQIKRLIYLSLMHHDMTVSEETHKKPEIILYHNETKGGIDRIDQMVQTYFASEKSIDGR